MKVGGSFSCGASRVAKKLLAGYVGDGNSGNLEVNKKITP